TRNLGTAVADFTPWDATDLTFIERLAEGLAERSDDILDVDLSDSSALSYRSLRAQLVAQTRTARVHPVLFRSAITRRGVDALLAGIVELLPDATDHAEAPASGTVFKIARTAAGERTSYVRMFTGTVRARDRIESARGTTHTVTAISVFEPGGTVQRQCV